MRRRGPPSPGPDLAGTASSFLGVTRFAFGGVAAPLVGLGDGGVGALAAVTVAGAALATVAYDRTLRRHRGPVDSGTAEHVEPTAGRSATKTAVAA